KILKHFCPESPEVLNFYRGNIVLDENGEAIVELPDYFSSININYSYHLTPIGNSAPNLYVKEEIKDNKFVIGGGKSGMKVSWEVYAERNDLYMQKHPNSKTAVKEKSKSEKGKYINPTFYGKSDEYRIYGAKKKIINSNERITNNLKLINPDNSRKNNNVKIEMKR
ncbi:MAG: hypothetical protein Q8880_08005, partial [Bacteroidota bacterium]|nr:hypothetical protein [Bacteroidota bacterium]